MTIALIIIGIILCLGWILWCILPWPWPQLAYIALILLQFTPTHPFSVWFLVLRWIINIGVMALDYLIPIWWTKKMWWSKYGTRWSTIGLLIGVILLPLMGIVIGPFWLIGIIWWPFLWAYVGEKIFAKKQHKQAIKAARWSFLWFLTGTILKLAITIIMIIAFISQAYKILF